MSPIEKAKELYNKYEKIFVDANADSWGKEAKQCALIAAHFALSLSSKENEDEIKQIITAIESL